MSKHVALEIIKSFTDEDLKNFTAYVNSPYLNSHGSLVKLWQELSKFHPAYDSPEMDDEKLGERMGIDEGTIRVYFPQLLTLCENFIGHEKQKIANDDFETIIIRELRNRKLFRSYNKKLEEFEKDLNERNEFYVSDFHTRFILENCKYEIDSNDAKVNNKKIFKELTERIFNMHNYLFYFYFFNAIYAYLNTIDFSKQLGVSPESTKLGIFFDTVYPQDKISKLLQGGTLLSDPLYKKNFELQWLFLQISLNNDVGNNFIKYRDILYGIENELHVDIKYNYYSICPKLLNYAAEHPEFNETEFSFYDDYFKKGAYKTVAIEIIPIRLFRYFCMRGDTARKFDWTSKILNEYIHVIDSECHDSIKTLREAYIGIIGDEKNYKHSLVLLETINDHREIAINRDVRLYTIMAQYELSHEDSLMGDETLKSIGKLRKYLSKESMPPIERTNYLKFARFVTSLTNFRIHKFDNINVKNLNKNIKRLRERIIKSEYSPSKEWILEKVQELEGEL